MYEHVGSVEDEYGSSHIEIVNDPTHPICVTVFDADGAWVSETCYQLEEAGVVAELLVQAQEEYRNWLVRGA